MDSIHRHADLLERKKRKEFLVHQHGPSFIVLEPQYGCRDDMWKRSIRKDKRDHSLLE